LCFLLFILYFFLKSQNYYFSEVLWIFKELKNNSGIFWNIPKKSDYTTREKKTRLKTEYYNLKVHVRYCKEELKTGENGTTMNNGIFTGQADALTCKGDSSRNLIMLDLIVL
ncbi:MAG: hypothetical protein PHD71_09260, partial [Methanospirillum sp.]|nr:hypothetical protein [Methanospirillum sp.]